MNKRLKQHIFSTIAILFGAILLVGSCKKQDEVYRKYIENGEILYLGKADSLLAYSGYQRAKVLWLPPKDPKVESIKVLWNDNQDSLLVPVKRHIEGDFQEVIIDNLTEGVQTFVVHSINSDGYSSIKSELNIPVYGESYIGSLLNRFPSGIEYWDNTLNVTFMAAEESVVMTEFTYTDIHGEIQIAGLPDSINTITIDDLDPDYPVRYRTEHSPDSNAIDQFFTAYEEMEVHDLGKTPIIFTGYCADPQGGDGNYEYLQLMATIDIDFSKTPFCVVTCQNGGSTAPDAGVPPSQGWAAGGGRTYKFNLTQGNVSKGEFFYVGGDSRLINGANSTNIEHAKWVRTINYTNTAGDGFGSSTSGLMPNSGYAAGMAVFFGMEVTNESSPVDVVFYGPTLETHPTHVPATIINEELYPDRGYRVAENDHYSPVDNATGVNQPFFWQGTNTHRIQHVTGQGLFIKLGGVFDTETQKWQTPRAYRMDQMSSSTPLSFIETGDGVTTIIN
ncbi:DUF4998 domain-containing protein [Sphingobacterium chuzhouense]|uniref:DUF4998 domain-containing protein n=1 Tax=Sphingobacterium chuzhouense TaxID=1742264 RepID=A0ABR7XLX7_9SPHI|nr:DUF4998 domain-containing protein [Sphingobacterium chuzhouense]MBD1420177.1 DUF4998 domain-containing protein [Sphingobacterium chuzhouense]